MYTDSGSSAPSSNVSVTGRLASVLGVDSVGTGVGSSVVAPVGEPAGIELYMHPLSVTAVNALSASMSTSDLKVASGAS